MPGQPIKSVKIPCFYFDTMLPLLRSHEWKALAYILRRTYDTPQTQTPITWQQIRSHTDIARHRLNQALGSLIYHRILAQPGNPYPSDTYVLQDPSVFEMDKLIERHQNEVEMRQFTEAGKK